MQDFRKSVKGMLKITTQVTPEEWWSPPANKWGEDPAGWRRDNRFFTTGELQWQEGSDEALGNLAKLSPISGKNDLPYASAGKVKWEEKAVPIANVNCVKIITQKIDQRFICTENWGIAATTT